MQSVSVRPVGVSLVPNARGESSGDALVEFGSEEEVIRALSLHRAHFGHRYLEIFRVGKGDAQEVSGRREIPPAIPVEQPPPRLPVVSSSTLRLRGLPFHVGNRDIANFFRGFQILPDLIQVNGLCWPLVHLNVLPSLSCSLCCICFLGPSTQCLFLLSSPSPLLSSPLLSSPLLVLASNFPSSDSRLTLSSARPEAGRQDVRRGVGDVRLLCRSSTRYAVDGSSTHWQSLCRDLPGMKQRQRCCSLLCQP
eukprot:752347-Hanusia_phi.AAC.2